MSTNEKLLQKEDLDVLFGELSKRLKKRIYDKSISVELIVVGGASILLNYDFRGSTVDIDCYDASGLLINEFVDAIAEKYDLPFDWINTDFIKSPSFSMKIVQFSEPYKTYGNGLLSIRTIKGKYLLAMKIVSGRRDKHDYVDMLGIIKDYQRRNEPLTIEDVDN